MHTEYSNTRRAGMQNIVGVKPCPPEVQPTMQTATSLFTVELRPEGSGYHVEKN